MRVSKRWLVVVVAAIAGLGATPALEAPAQTRGGQIVIGLPWRPVVLNPPVESDGVSYLVNLWIYDSLIRLSSSRGFEVEPEP